MGTEQRQSTRHPVRFKIVYDDGSTFNAGTVINISDGGVFLQTAIPLDKGTEIVLTPVDDAGQTFEVRACVVRVIPFEPGGPPAGMGLQFLGLTEAERDEVVRVIRAMGQSAQRAADPYLGVRAAPQTGGDESS